MANRMMRWFESQHLPPHLRDVSQRIETMAHILDMSIADGAEKSAGMRKLLEAKDCFVRAVIEAQPQEA